MVCATSKASDQPAHTRSLIRAFANSLNIMIVKLLTEHHLEFLSLKGGCRGLSESTQVKMPDCWKSHATAHIISHFSSSKDPTKEPMTSRLPIQDVHHHDFRSKMSAITTADPRWLPRDLPVTRSVTPRRVSQSSRPREGSVTS